MILKVFIFPVFWIWGPLHKSIKAGGRLASPRGTGGRLTSTKVNQRTIAVHSAALASHELVDVVQLVFAVGKHFFQIVFGDL
jgi:hypothetical protein